MINLKAITIVSFILVHLAGANQSNLSVNVSFRYPKATKLKIEFYSVKPEFTFSVARTGVSDSINKTPADQKIINKFDFTPSKAESSFVLLVKNDSSQTKYFFANPHTYKPESTALSAVFECLCNHHVYTIPPNTVWFRVVRLDVNFDMVPKGSKKLEIVHDFVEVSEADAKSKYKQLIYEQL